MRQSLSRRLYDSASQIVRESDRARERACAHPLPGLSSSGQREESPPPLPVVDDRVELGPSAEVLDRHDSAR